MVFFLNALLIVLNANLGAVFGTYIESELGGVDIIGESRLPATNQLLENITEKFPEISFITPIYVVSGSYNNRYTGIVTMEHDFYEETTFKFKETISEKPWEILEGTNGSVVITERFSSINNVSINDNITLDYQSRVANFTIIAVVKSRVFEEMTFLNKYDFSKLIPAYFSIENNIPFFIMKKSDKTIDSDSLCAQIEREFWYYGMDVHTMKEEASLFQGYFKDILIYIQLISYLSLFCGSISLISVTLRNVKDRESIWQLLRALGYSKERIKFLILFESSIISTFAVILAILSGSFLNFFLFNTSFKEHTFIFPGVDLILYGVVMICLSLVIIGFTYLLVEKDTFNSNEIIFNKQH